MQVMSKKSILFLLLVFCFSGCDQERLRTYHVSGQVLFDDQPVVEGIITFTPSTNDGSRGAQSVAFILNGKFDTKAGKGVTAGPVTATISGSERNSNGEGVRSTFAEYVEEFEMPKRNFSIDFNLTKEDLKKK